MRHLLTICFLLSAFCLTAQTYPKDSTWNAQEGLNWFAYRQTHTSATDYTLTKRLIGTDTVLAQTYTDAARNRSATMANDARAVQRFRTDITETLRSRDATQAQIGIDYLRALQNEVAPSLTGGAWEIKTDSLRLVSFNVTAQGVLRYSITGYSTRRAHVLGDVMRFERFEGGPDPVDLYRDGDKWRNLSGSIVLRPVGSGNRLSRSSLEPPTGGVVSEKMVSEATVITNPMVMQETAKPKAKTTKKKTTKKQ